MQIRIRDVLSAVIGAIALFATLYAGLIIAQGV